MTATSETLYHDQKQPAGSHIFDTPDAVRVIEMVCGAYYAYLQEAVIFDQCGAVRNCEDASAIYSHALKELGKMTSSAYLRCGELYAQRHHSKPAH